MKYLIFTCEKDSAKLSKFVLSKVHGLGYGSFLKILADKDIKVNSKRINKDVLICKNDVVEIYLKKDMLNTFVPDIVYRSEHIIVFNKPKKISTEAFAEAVKNSVDTNLLACHRLDTNTTGLIIFAKDKPSFEIIKQGLNNGQITKKYLARVVGEYRGEKTYEAYLTKDREKAIVSISATAQPKAVKIATIVKGLKASDGKGLVEVTLLTGKTHQIRAHLSYLGFPILGDPKYGDFSFNKLEELTSQQLCAYKLKFNFDKKSPLSYLNDIELQLDNPLN